MPKGAAKGRTMPSRFAGDDVKATQSARKLMSGRLQNGFGARFMPHFNDQGFKLRHYQEVE
jgi:hypothetical protein